MQQVFLFQVQDSTLVLVALHEVHLWPGLTGWKHSLMECQPLLQFCVTAEGALYPSSRSVMKSVISEILSHTGNPKWLLGCWIQQSLCAVELGVTAACFWAEGAEAAVSLLSCSALRSILAMLNALEGHQTLKL